MHLRKVENVKINKVNQLISSIEDIILDKSDAIRLSVTCLLAQGHLLIEDRPGMGKTSLVKTLSKLIGIESQRIQFTNDLLPADIIGTSIFDKENNQFKFIKGPIFSHFVIADEINRATPKTQSACLQAMEENKITVDRETYELMTPFFLVATQNPQDNIGTFALPESQMDRFLMRLELGLPSRKAEREILTGQDRNHLISELKPLLSLDEILDLFTEVDQVHVSESCLDYVQDIIEKSRQLSIGLSPRGARDFNKAAKAFAFVNGRQFVIPEDYQRVGVAVMGHRLSSDNSNISQGNDMAKELLHSVAVP